MFKYVCNVWCVRRNNNDCYMCLDVMIINYNKILYGMYFDSVFFWWFFKWIVLWNVLFINKNDVIVYMKKVDEV